MKLKEIRKSLNRGQTIKIETFKINYKKNKILKF